MRQRTKALVGVGIIAVVAFLFLAPIVPFSKTFYVSVSGNVPPSSPRCSNLFDVSSLNPTLEYKGYESVGYSISGVGIMFYSECTMLS